MPCYEWGGFYQQQIQAVGFSGGSGAHIVSVKQCPLCVPVRFLGVQGTDLQSFLPFEALGAWLRVTAAPGSWGLRIPAASAF